MCGNGWFQAFNLPDGRHGARTSCAGDMLFADKKIQLPGCKTRVAIGDIGIFVYPNDRTQYYIKRVIGLPGDRVSIASHKCRRPTAVVFRDPKSSKATISWSTEAGGIAQLACAMERGASARAPRLRYYGSRPARYSCSAINPRLEHRLPPVRHGAAFRSRRQRTPNLVLFRRGDGVEVGLGSEKFLE